MMLLKNRDQTPPDGFRYVHVESGFVSRAIDIYNWFENIKAHRKANGYPPITVEQAMDQQCATLPPQWCEHDSEQQGSRDWVNTRLHWRHIAEGMKAYLALIVSGFKTVDQEEANRRARICASCYLKVTPQGCGACLKLSQLITGDIAQKKTPYEDQLVNKACAVCSCAVSSIVHFPMSALDKNDTPEKQNAYPDFCWRKVSGNNRIEEAS